VHPSVIDHQFVRQLIFVYPLLKCASSGAVFYNTCLCLFYPELGFSWANRYVMMIFVTTETIFWACFCGFQYIVALGVGTTTFEFGHLEAKRTLYLIVGAYILHSGYFVALDNSFFNPVIKHCQVMQYAYLLYVIIGISLYNFSLVQRNMNFVRAQDLSEQSSDYSRHEDQGLYRFMPALILKRRLIVINTICTSLILLTELCSIIINSSLEAFEFPPSTQSNGAKVGFMAAKETLYFSLIAVTLLANRVTSTLPDFFMNRLDRFPGHAGFDNERPQYAKIHRVKLTKRQILESSFDSWDSQAQYEKVVVLNPVAVSSRASETAADQKLRVASSLQFAKNN